jgi:hypothetical protein
MKIFPGARLSFLNITFDFSTTKGAKSSNWPPYTEKMMAKWTPNFNKADYYPDYEYQYSDTG